MGDSAFVRSCLGTEAPSILFEIEVGLAVLGVVVGSVPQLLPDVVVPEDEVRHVGERPEDGLLQLGTVLGVKEVTRPAPDPVDVVEDGDAEVSVRDPGGRAAVVLVRAHVVVGTRRARHGGALLLGER